MLRILLLATLLGGTLGSAEAQAPTPPAAHKSATVQPAQLDKNGVLILVRSIILALDQANQTGNYTVLRDLGSDEFRQANTAARLGDIFQPLRAQSLDLSGVAALEPQLTLLPQIETNGQLHMAGFFPSVPLQIRFDLSFAPAAQHWRVSSLSVLLGSAMPSPAAGTPADAGKHPPAPAKGDGKAPAH